MDSSSLKDLISKISEINKKNGWDPTPFPTSMALVHTEVSEAVQADRKSKWVNEADVKELQNDAGGFSKEIFEEHIKDHVQDELADVLIRTLYICDQENIDIEWFIEQKLQYNSTRGFRYGGNNKY